MENPFLIELRGSRHQSGLGNKGQGLFWLAKHHLKIPHTLVLTYEASEKISRHPDGLDPEIARAIAQHIDPEKYYAVRSSASVEDGAHLSFAGQFTTRTNVSGLDNLLDAIREVISSGNSSELAPYVNKLGENGPVLQMAVLIQEMVRPVLSGVSFSKNPTTGLDEVVIEAVQGLGEDLMQHGVTPDRWIFRWGQFTESPDGHDTFDQIIRKIAQETRQIAKRYGKPVDLEWAYDGQNIFWLQIRPITMLSQVALYSNRIAREVLPGIIKPLISSINIPLVNTAWIRLFDELLGPTKLKPEELTRMFHYRAYFNMGSVGKIFEMLGFPRESLEMLLGFPVKSERPPPSLRTLRHFPRLLRFAAQAWNYDRRVSAEMKSFENHLVAIQQEEVHGLSERELTDRIHGLFSFNVRVAYQNIVIPLLMNLYNAVLRSQLKRSGIDLVHFDVTAGMEEIRKYDPNVFLDQIKETYGNFPAEMSEILRTQGSAPLQNDPRYAGFDQQLSDFIHLFGHLSENGSDFSRPPWREDPDALVRMVISHTTRERGQQKINWDTAKISAFSRLMMKPIYLRARRMRLRREQISSIYTFSYGWFRVLFHPLAESFVKRGILRHRDDIFYLSWQEILSIVDSDPIKNEVLTVIDQRKQEVDASAGFALPETIYGNSPPPLLPTVADSQKRSGIPTSPGYYQGPLKIILSVDDFEQVLPGDVIAIPYSDVAWTPLFAKAGAVIAEAGGILSHSSIVAREYGIPCIVSVNGATHLPKNSIVYVDGYRGEVSIMDH